MDTATDRPPMKPAKPLLDAEQLCSWTREQLLSPAEELAASHRIENAS